MDSLERLAFTKLSIKDKELFDRYFQRMNDDWASSVCFASMITWNSSIPIYHKVIGEYLCCLAQDTSCSKWSLLPYIGHYDMEAMEACTQEVLEIMKELNLPVIFTDISEWMLPYYLNLKAIRLKADYDVGLSDYIYRYEDFMTGLDRQYCRYDYHYFIRKNNPVLVEMDNPDPTQYLEYLKKVWCSSHSCSYCQYGCLLDSAANLIGALDEAGAKGIAVYMDQQVVGYTVISREGNQLVFHLKKGIHGMRGLSEYMHRYCCERYGDGVKLINYTEDMNIEGLRRYKQKLATDYKLSHKYELTVL